ncbi:28S ribosomal protein S24, mitochondrial isoform X2 [Trachypithecus francoisi]|uniref:28S ribosomal protein S24, mitochondrial isoform X2 n=1 Tax=Trachypithecus francoisi TaxID=54180 RepID=UPI00141B91A9|nr:28S ribosomal protein S24, mitochondrial isoform X2 [Trachypithecus francoisi]
MSIHEAEHSQGCGEGGSDSYPAHRGPAPQRPCPAPARVQAPTWSRPRLSPPLSALWYVPRSARPKMAASVCNGFLGRRVLSWSRELPCAWRALHTSAVCAKVTWMERTMLQSERWRMFSFASSCGVPSQAAWLTSWF